MVASNKRHLDVVKTLILKRANVNQTTKVGIYMYTCTLLSYSIKCTLYIALVRQDCIDTHVHCTKD